MNIKNLLAAAMLAGVTCGYAQTADWLVLPQYDAIEFCAPNLYKVSKSGRMGLITSSGKVILKPEYDFIDNFYEGRAIFGTQTYDGSILRGVVTEDGSVNMASGEYYLLDYYPFYSEGLIPVQQYDGLYGYLDEQCRPAFRFTADETRPFSEGMAAVGEGDNFHWLTLSGEKITFTLPNGGIPYGGTNFHDGKAYLWDEDGVFFTYDDTGRVAKTSPRNLEVDYLYRVDSGKGENIEYASYNQSFENTWTPTQKNGMWTFTNTRGKLLTPFRYENVNYFSNGSAMAMSDGKWGLLEVVEDNSTFFTKALKRDFIFSDGNPCECSFNLSVPEKWKGEPLTVTLRDPETGERIRLVKKSDTEYTFSYRPEAGKASVNKTFEVEVNNDDITLWKGEEAYKFAQRTKLIASVRVNNADANSSNRCLVTATVKNPSSIPVTTTVSLTGGGTKSMFDNKTVTVTIPPHGTKSLTSSFIVNKVELNGWCAVKTSDGVTAHRGNLQLKPF